MNIGVFLYALQSCITTYHGIPTVFVDLFDCKYTVVLSTKLLKKDTVVLVSVSTAGRSLLGLQRRSKQIAIGLVNGTEENSKGSEHWGTHETI